MSKPRVIAFYLPQFHTIPENDEWWGKGFTEWTNVGKAKPLFPGHKQPKVPKDLGYYDLRVPEIYDEQTELAKEAGIEGFCFWHYYFGDGKQLLEKPLQRIVKENKNTFPFCLGWANESWEKKLWNKDTSKNITLIEQKYNDVKEHFYHILPILKSNNYITVDGKLLFLIYRPNEVPNCAEFIKIWRELAQKELKKDFHFIAHANGTEKDYLQYTKMGFDGVYSNRVWASTKGFQYNFIVTIRNILCKILFMPRLVNFADVIKSCINDKDKEENIYPGIICGWDHTPRSGRKGCVFFNFNKKTFSKHVKSVLSVVNNKNKEHQIVFLKSWNEWGEGNFMEPDMEFGLEKIEVLRREIDKYS